MDFITKRIEKKIIKPIIFGLILMGMISCNDDELTPDQETYTKIELFMGTGIAGLGNLGQNSLETPLYLPHDLTIGPDGFPYIMDWNNHRILVVEDNKVRLLIGTGELGDAQDGQATDISLNHPTNVSFDPDGHLILSAWHNSKVMRMDLKTGFIEAICGNGQRSYGGDGGNASDAIVDLPNSTVFDTEGNMYISDQGNNRIRIVDTHGMIETFAGNGNIGFSGDGGPATEASIFTGGGGQVAFPAGKIAIDSKNNLYIPDTGNGRIRMVSTDGIIHTIAGTGEVEFYGDSIPAIDASLNWPSDVAIDSEDNIYIADSFNHCIRKIDKEGIITTFAGIPGEQGADGIGGKPREARMYRPYGIAFDSEDNLYIADTQNHRILVVYKYSNN